MSSSRAVVVGAGVAGLAAARDLVDAGWDVLVLEQAAYAGGKLRAAEVAGVSVDVGSEAMLNRRPEGVDLAVAVGLDVIHPAVVASRIWSRGALRALPRSLMGVPLDLDQLAASEVLSEDGLARARQERDLPASVVADGEDLSVGDLVDRRFGPEVTDRLVEPLLGGVYSGHARRISVRAAVPQLLAHAVRGSVLERAGSIPTTYDGPVFAGLEGGMSRLPTALAEQLRAAGAEVRLGTTVRALRRTPQGFELTVGSAADPELVSAGAVVLATPPAATARLLADCAPVAADALGGIEGASVAVVTLALRARDTGDPGALEALGSGFLVPPVEQRRIKAATFSFAKWAWVRRAGERAEPGDPLLVLRASVGRAGEERSLQVDDEDLVAATLADLTAATGLAATPVDTHVQRWGGGLPQYAVGHLDVVARVRAAVARVPGLAVCGAAYDGVGIPAVVASAHVAAASLGAPPSGSSQRGTMEP